LTEEGEGSHRRRFDAATVNSDIKSNYCRHLYVVNRRFQKLLTKHIFGIIFFNRSQFLDSHARVYTKNHFLYRRHTNLQGREANYIRKLSVTLLERLTSGITKTSKFWFEFLSSSLLRGQLGVCVCVCVNYLLDDETA